MWSKLTFTPISGAIIHPYLVLWGITEPSMSVYHTESSFLWDALMNILWQPKGNMMFSLHDLMISVCSGKLSLRNIYHWILCCLLLYIWKELSIITYSLWEGDPCIQLFMYRIKVRNILDLFGLRSGINANNILYSRLQTTSKYK